MITQEQWSKLIMLYTRRTNQVGNRAIHNDVLVAIYDEVCKKDYDIMRLALDDMARTKHGSGGIFFDLAHVLEYYRKYEAEVLSKRERETIKQELKLSANERKAVLAEVNTMLERVGLNLRDDRN